MEQKSLSSLNLPSAYHRYSRRRLYVRLITSEELKTIGKEGLYYFGCSLRGVITSDAPIYSAQELIGRDNVFILP